MNGRGTGSPQAGAVLVLVVALLVLHWQYRSTVEVHTHWHWHAGDWQCHWQCHLQPEWLGSELEKYHVGTVPFKAMKHNRRVRVSRRRRDWGRWIGKGKKCNTVFDSALAQHPPSFRVILSLKLPVMRVTRPARRLRRLNIWNGNRNWTFGMATDVVSTHGNIQKPFPDVLVESRYDKGD